MVRKSDSGPSAALSVSERTLPARPAPAPAPERTALRRGLEGVVRFLGSFSLAVTLLLLLLALTTLGTFAQADTSLFDVQKRYFESFGLIEDIGPISVPLPGGATCLGLLAVNLVVGGLIRIRKSSATVGILIGHAGILFLLGGSLVEALASDKGQLTLREGESGATFQSYYEWELVLRERKPDGTATEWIVPDARLKGLTHGDTLRVSAAGLPFEAVASEWVRNARPKPADSPSQGVGGWLAEVKDPDPSEAQNNMPSLVLSVGAPGVGVPTRQALLWAAQSHPWPFEVGGRRFEADLRRRSWSLPFTIQLDKFEKEDHPGISMAKRFSSFVTKLEGGSAQKAHITMNEPLRQRGYTLYQSGWGPQIPNPPPGTRFSSTFSVVRNPSDRVPLYACIVIAVGLLWHYLGRLARHLKAEAARRPAVKEVA